MNENEIITNSFQDEVVQTESEPTSDSEEIQIVTEVEHVTEVELVTEVEHLTEVELVTEVEHVTEFELVTAQNEVTDITTSYVTGVSTTPDIYQRMEHLEKNSDGQLLFLGGLFFLIVLFALSGFLKSLIF